MCLFVAFPVLDQPETFNAMVEIINGFYDINLTADDVTALGRKVLDAELDFNARAGFTALDDRLPRFFEEQPLAPHDVTFMVTDAELDAVFTS
jgi:aldehyde:ferredoxin oxidoreductase